MLNILSSCRLATGRTCANRAGKGFRARTHCDGTGAPSRGVGTSSRRRCCKRLGMERIWRACRRQMAPARRLHRPPGPLQTSPRRSLRRRRVAPVRACRSVRSSTARRTGIRYDLHCLRCAGADTHGLYTAHPHDAHAVHTISHELAPAKMEMSNKSLVPVL